MQEPEFEKQSTRPSLHSWNTVGLIMDSLKTLIQQIQRYHRFIPRLFLPLPTMQYTHCHYRITCSFLWSHKKLYITLFTHAVALD